MSHRCTINVKQLTNRQTICLRTVTPKQRVFGLLYIISYNLATKKTNQKPKNKTNK